LTTNPLPARPSGEVGTTTTDPFAAMKTRIAPVAVRPATRTKTIARADAIRGAMRTMTTTTGPAVDEADEVTRITSPIAVA